MDVLEIVIPVQKPGLSLEFAGEGISVSVQSPAPRKSDLVAAIKKTLWALTVCGVCEWVIRDIVLHALFQCSIRG